MPAVPRALRALGAFLAAATLTVAAMVAAPTAAHAIPAHFDGVNIPVISGTPAAGSELTVSLDVTSTVPTPESVTFEWVSPDGPGHLHTGETFTPGDALLGKTLYVRARLQAADIPDAYTMVSVVVGPGQITGTGAPTIALAGPSADLRPGSTVVVEARGLPASTEYQLELHSTPLPLGSATSAADGTLSTRVTIPAGAPAGPHRIVLLQGGVEVASMPVTVTATDTLPATGLDAAGATAATAAGLLALTAGSALVLLRRRFARAL